MKKSFCYLLLLIPSFCFAQKFDAGVFHSLAICNDSSVQAWGYGASGQLGNGSLFSSNVPVSVSSLTSVIAVSVGSGYSLALKSDGTVWAWGANYHGELGIGTIGSGTETSIPVQVLSLSNISSISASESDGHNLALKNDGTVWVWGENANGQLGIGNNIDQLTPIQLTSLTNIIAVSAGGNYSLALKNDGTLWSFGINYQGQLGIGTISVGSNIPVQITSLTGVTNISTGSYHCKAMKNDGTVWAWGSNTDGEFGDGTNTNSSIPVQISALTGASIALAGSNNGLELKSDGTVWTSGGNSSGSLGIGTFSTPSLSLVQTNLLSNVTAISIGRHSLALKGDGTLWSWGYNFEGQLGIGTNFNSNIPVQIMGLCQNVTNINEEKEDILIEFFPNPSNSLIQIQTNSTFINSEYLIVNQLGQVLLSGEITTKNTSVDISELSKGVYFFKLKKGTKKNFKIVKI
jgi:alpha-tubulin suppressor-like RCC1 family protein